MYLATLHGLTPRQGSTSLAGMRFQPGVPRTPEEQAFIDAMWVSCPYCGADEGIYCETEFGTTLYRPHKDRFKRAASFKKELGGSAP